MSNLTTWANLTVCIPNRFSWNGVVLTVESALKRTRYAPGFRILVADNSMAANNRCVEPPRELEPGADDGGRLDYLRAMAEYGQIDLIENAGQDRRYGHGENLRVMLDACRTDYALLFNSTSEIIRPDWLDVLVNLIRDPGHDLGVARFRSGGNHWEHCWIAPTYWPNMMLLNMRLYRAHFPDHRWELRQMPEAEFEHMEIFAGMRPPSDPEPKPIHVFCDTGWTLYKKLHYDNAVGLRMQPLPDNYWNVWIKWLGGIDRNSHRPSHPHVVQTLAEIDRRLAALRGEK